MEDDRDLLEIFDAVLPRLEPYGWGAVPPAGASESKAHANVTDRHRADLTVWSLVTGALGGMTWLMWGPWLPMWLMTAATVMVLVPGAMAGRSFLRLAFGQRLEGALPPGTDAATAQLEDGTWNKIRWWNYDASDWHERVAALRTEVSDWQVQRDVPEARGIEWTEAGSKIRAEGLIAAMQGLADDRRALAARKDEIDHDRRRLDARLCQLKASEEAPTLALPAPESDPDDPSEP